jgi:VWFA-related protein
MDAGSTIVSQPFRFALLSAALCSAALAAAVQNPQAPTFRSSVTYVEVDVSVLDRERRPVRGLTRADFVLLEDGRPQPIETFGAVDVPSATEPTAEWMRTVSPDVRANITASDGRLLVLVLDDAQVRFDPRMTAAVKNIGRRVVSQLGPADLASVVFTRDSRRAQDFTSDQVRLLAAIESFAPAFSAPTPMPPPEPGMTLGAGDQSTNYFYQASVNTLERTTEFLATVPQRRKAVIYVSVGVPVMIGSVTFSSTDPFDVMGRLRTRLQEVFRKAQRANVNVYSIDPSGLGGLDGETNQSLGLPSAQDDVSAQSAMRDFLLGLSENTGGFAIINRDDFKSGVDQIFRENGSYYLLGYRPLDAAQDGKLRRIEVRVRRPGLTVRARGAYTAPKANGNDTAGAPDGALLGSAATALVPKADLGMQVTAVPFAIPGKRDSNVAIVLGVRQPAPQGAASQKTIADNVDVLVGAYSSDGRRRASESVTATLRLRSGVGPVQYELFSLLALPPGSYQLRLAAHSSLEDKTGSVFYEIEVPDVSKQDFAVTGLMLTSDPALAVGGKDRLAAILPVAPTTRRQFDTSEKVTAFLRLYQGAKATLSTVDVTTRILDDRGMNVFTRGEVIAADRFSGSRTADYQSDVPLARLRPGRYLLTVEATRRAGGQARRDVAFGVR